MKGALQAGELSQNEGLFIFRMSVCFYRKKSGIVKIQSDMFLSEGWAEQVEGIDDLLTQIGDSNLWMDSKINVARSNMNYCQR